jgi:hypothetical protein
LKSVTLNSDHGEITITAKQITLVTRAGEVFIWPPDFKRVPRLDTIDKHAAAQLLTEGKARYNLLAHVIPSVIAHSAEYSKHPVVRDWIVSNEMQIAVLRSKFVAIGDERIWQATKNLAAVDGRSGGVAAKKGYKRRDVMLAARFDELYKAATPLHREWWRLRNSHRYQSGKRKDSVAAAFIPTPFGADYDRILAAEIKQWCESFNCKEARNARTADTSLRRSVLHRLRQEFRGVSFANLRRGRTKPAKRIRRKSARVV